MRKPGCLHRTKHIKFVYLIVIALAILSATPVLADYIGPNRTVTVTTTDCSIVLYECKYVASKGDYRYKQVDNWSCSNESKPWKSYSSQPSSQGCNSGSVGDTYWSSEETSQDVTTTYPPATITGELQNCTLNNGWCNTVPQIALSAYEPVAGYSILGIEGTWNNQGFACPGSTSCKLSLAEGLNDFVYWAHSSWTDTSEPGYLSARVDSKLPNISGTLTGTLGSNGWYTSPVVYKYSASDATSGLATLTCVLDGIFLTSGCNPVNVNNDGPHTLVVKARDYAGLLRTLTQNPSIDTHPPTIDLSLIGARDTDSDWYTNVKLAGSAKDALPGSGLSTFEYQVDDGAWTVFPASGELALPEGKHAFTVRAKDKAGLTVSSGNSFWLDSVAPSIALEPAGTFGTNNWYITDLILSASAEDETSGVHVFEYSLDNDSWKEYNGPLVLADGVHGISFWVEDDAGLVTQVRETYKVDSRAPVIGGGLSGIPGENGWFTSDVILTASASDPQPGSGLDAFTYALDGNPEISYTDPLTLSDGQHTIQLHARDGAGLSFRVEQGVHVDTIPPSLELQTTPPTWIKDDFAFDGLAGDSGSGISRVEISTDGGQSWQTVGSTPAWSYLWNTTNGPSGSYEIVVRAVDQAGLVTSQTLHTGVDNQAPGINLPDSWFQWNTITLDIWDEYSGLSSSYVEVSDPEGRWPARIIDLDTAQFPMEFKWDRRFADETVAPAGTYDVKVVALDHLGHTTTKTASIKVIIDIWPSGPTSTPQPTETSTLPPTATLQFPPSLTVSPPATFPPGLTYTPTTVLQTPAGQTPTVTSQPSLVTDLTPTAIKTSTTIPIATATRTMIIQVFGSTAGPQPSSTPNIAATPTLRATPANATVQNVFDSFLLPQASSATTTTEIDLSEEDTPSHPTGSNVLWGATAAAVMGSMTAYALEEKRKRDEEKARQQALASQAAERHSKIIGKKMAKLEAKWALERAQKAAREAEQERREAHYQAHMESRLLGREIKEEEKRAAEQKALRERNAAKKQAEEEKKKAEDLKAGMAAYYNARKQGETTAAPPKEKSFWEKGLDWVDKHQSEVALGLGIGIGIAAIVLSGGIATPLVAAAWTVGAALTAAGVAAVGTVALNVHYQRKWNTNVLKNVALAEAAALAVSGGWFLLHGAMTGMGAYCALNQTTCARVEPVLNAIDTLEQVSLQAKGSYQLWRGDAEGASQTALDLQMEYLDGGMPGNSVAKELGADALVELAKHGDEALKLVKLYGVDAVEIILKYKDDGIKLLQKHGVDAINLIARYEDDAIRLLKVVDPGAAANLLKTLDDDVIDYALDEGPDALEALSRWSAEDLSRYGPGLALRSKKDAKALENVKKLIASGPIDPVNLTEEQKAIISSIAENSTQYADEGQIVLGKWIDYGNGFVERAQDTGSGYYNPHPDIWNTLGELGDENQSEVAWLINQQVIQTGINKNLPFEYTLSGIPIDKIDSEKRAFEAVFSGATNIELMNILKTNYLPVRIQEIQELQMAGYQFTFDELTDTFILARP